MVIEEAIRYIDNLHEMLHSRLGQTQLHQTHSRQGILRCPSLYLCRSVTVGPVGLSYGKSHFSFAGRSAIGSTL